MFRPLHPAHGVEKNHGYVWFLREITTEIPEESESKEDIIKLFLVERSILNNKLVLILIIIALLFSACGSPDPKAGGQASVAYPSISDKAAPLPIEAQKSSPICVPNQKDAQIKPGPFTGYPQAILNYLNQGRSIKELDETLYRLGVANQPVTTGDADLTGDGKTDLVVSIFDATSNSMPPAGELLVYICQGQQYVLAYTEPSQPGTGAPGIRYLQDLNEDGRAELVSSSPICGAHTCFEAAEILSWNGKAFENRLEGISNDLPYPTINITDQNQDGIFDLEIIASGVGSVGAGPQRSLLRRWSYQAASGRWQPVGDFPGPSNYRIHVLADADTAAAQRDYANALLLYQRTASDITLQDFTDPASERANLGAYARFKMVEIFTLLNQEDFANASLSELAAAAAPDMPQYGFLRMAQSFRKFFSQAGISSACQAVQKYAANHPDQVLDVLGSRVFGSGNKDYTPQDMCPW